MRPIDNLVLDHVGVGRKVAHDTDPLAGLAALEAESPLARVPTPAPPREAATLQPLVPSVSGGEEAAFLAGYRAILGEYGWGVAWAEHVLYCESGGNPLAYNSAGPYVGLMQVWLGHRWTYEQLVQPEINIAAAWEIYQRQGAAAWPVCGQVLQ